MSAIITLTTDFGTLDYYVAAVKGKILQSLSAVHFIDISHQIPSGDIAQAAYTLQRVYNDFPEQTLHILAVNTHTNNDQHLLVRHANQYFMMPDNGMISLLFPEEPQEVIQLNLTEDYLTSFPSKTLYTEVAVLLSEGVSMQDLGTSTQEYLKKVYPKLTADETAIRGRVIHVDGYGNLITNLKKEMLEEWRDGEKLEVQVGHEKVYRIAKNFTECDFGDCIVMYNHANELLIGIRQGNASQLLGMRYDSSVIVKKVK